MDEKKAAAPPMDVTALRVALAVPLAYEVYRLVTFGVAASSWSLPSWLFGKGVLLLPALGLALGCVLLFVGRTWRWAWLLVLTSGLWVAFVDAYPHIQVTYPWRPSVDLVMGVYAVVLALAFLVGAHRPRGERSGGTSAG
jgi:hypothetical protein